KAEHRKELHTNLLANRMGRLVQGMKSGSQNTSAVIWVLAILTAAVVVGWFFASGVGSSRSDVWVRLNSANDPQALGEIARTNGGTMPALVARFQRARLLLQQGLNNLFPDQIQKPEAQADQRDQAIKDLEEVRSTYEVLAAECRNDPLLSQEAWLGNAKAEEALAGVPQANDPQKKRGDLGKAINLYQKFLAKVDPDTPYAQDLRKHVDALEKYGSSVPEQDETKVGPSVEEFYTQLNNFAAPATQKAEGRKQ
ncbi:MAG: hypothetical protein JO112_23000, partial [Planctomycetes bacterium]|nr:hypothetical protein [Planctomycetota bacterium]